MKVAEKITEQASIYEDLETMSTNEILSNINKEDQKVAKAVQNVIPQIEQFVEKAIPGFLKGGRLFYIGAGTSGRLGILDASEIPPTYGMAADRVIGLIAGGDKAIRKAVEFAEDSLNQAAEDLEPYQLNENDTLLGIASSGTTPYVLGGIAYAKEKKVITGGLTNNPGSPLALAADIPIEVVVGPEFVTGSTRMKSGTSQKLVLNMISTALMIRIGRVKGNKMINMQLSNKKLINRGIRQLMEELEISEKEATSLLEQYGSVKEALENRS
ncbi:N-acetylmuramic acid 6-phosphate etherase [Xanthovirga aplysinae]|uniref:N-acetylmuramic acid 6-phosphate etherase n=1 Tax=Xanthovirga aplysinae TaxID=2529853 RepID=UPI0012BC3366|nr:N-acetylmuramic acid 6-phosphate etherase [Xanthovirga aplysinae]MTI32570.1 N-acetylmuramic acid 6-phosphate etherase [Xanthovirga aplysinae]